MRHMSKRPSRPAAVAAVHKLTEASVDDGERGFAAAGFRAAAFAAAPLPVPPPPPQAAGAAAGGGEGAADDSIDQTSDDSEAEDGDDDEAEEADGDNKQARAAGVVAGGVGAPAVFKKEKTKWTKDEVGF